MAGGDSGRLGVQKGQVGFAFSSDSLARRRSPGQPPPLPGSPARGRYSAPLQTEAALLADRLSVPLAGWDAVFLPIPAESAESIDDLELSARIRGKHYRVLCAHPHRLPQLARRIAELEGRGMAVALAPRFLLEAAVEDQRRPERIDEAVYGLLRRSAVSSAGTGIWWRQIFAAAMAVGLIGGGLAAFPGQALAVLTAIVAIPFLCITLLRLMALSELFARRRGADETRGNPDPDDELPLYSVLVPLFQEANVLGGLVQSLAALDYPTAKLEIFLILEQADLETQAALLAIPLPSHFRTIVVPDQAPRTKPKALNYALQFARGDYVVVYDAEDRPQPDQLRRALGLFRADNGQLGCVQAQLNIYNHRASWFTRQFTIEYSALFDAILPALVRLRFPVPLGGTSNHFLRRALVAAGGWDPFNVTEDADLGFRLARRGWRTAVLASTTWEEAPTRFGSWFRQRTRWLKGWMQTYLVHTRQPWRLTRELGVRGVVGVHVLMGALILSALVHPLFYVLLGYHAFAGGLLVRPDTALGAGLWAIACTNLLIGYAVSILAGVVSVVRRGRPGLIVSALFMPVCWLLISAAAYRAVYQLAVDPFLWEKTAHGTAPPPARANGRAR